MFISRYITLGNDSWNLYQSKIARQVDRKIEECNNVFNKGDDEGMQVPFGLKIISEWKQVDL